MRHLPFYFPLPSSSPLLPALLNTDDDGNDVADPILNDDNERVVKEEEEDEGADDGSRSLRSG